MRLARQGSRSLDSADTHMRRSTADGDYIYCRTCPSELLAERRMLGIIDFRAALSFAAFLEFLSVFRAPLAAFPHCLCNAFPLTIGSTGHTGAWPRW
jgi:hypothetical protein